MMKNLLKDKNILPKSNLTDSSSQGVLLSASEDLISKCFFYTIGSLVITSFILSVVFYFLKFVPNAVDYAYILSHLRIISGFNPEAPERDRYIALTFLFPILFTLSLRHAYSYLICFFCYIYFRISKMQQKYS